MGRLSDRTQANKDIGERKGAAGEKDRWGKMVLKMRQYVFQKYSLQ